MNQVQVLPSRILLEKTIDEHVRLMRQRDAKLAGLGQTDLDIKIDKKWQEVKLLSQAMYKPTFR